MIPALGKLRQDDQEFEVSLNDIEKFEVSLNDIKKFGLKTNKQTPLKNQ